VKQWQPIETAPRDGTDILLAFPGYKRACIGHYYDRTEMKFGQVVRESRGWHDGYWLHIGDEVPEPTHWMPLPTLPDASADRATMHNGSLDAERIA
jgi:hypothetical protein